MESKSIIFNTTNIKSLYNDKLEALVLLSQNGDSPSKELLIKKYYSFIVSKTKNIYLTDYTFDDLIQNGVATVLRCINTFNVSNGIETFNPYVISAIKNNFNYLLRQEIRYNQVLSLNTTPKENQNPIESIPYPETTEEIIVKRLNLDELRLSLKKLEPEEFELIKFLYLDVYHKTPFLSAYAKLNNKDYYYCTCLKKRALIKLKSFLDCNIEN